MKIISVLVTLILFLTGAFAQQNFLDRLPNCALKCLQVTLPTSKCSPSDINCLCADATFMQAAGACNAANCTVVEVLRSANETYAACGIPVHDQSATLIGMITFFGSVALIMVAVRVTDRAISSQAELGWDDLLIGLSGITSLGMNVPVIVAAHLGFGRDMWSIPPDNITVALKWLYVAYFCYQIAEALCQLSILAFYLRIMVDPKLRLVVWILGGAVTCFGIGNTFSMIFQCTPISFFWNGWKREMPGKCGVNVQLFGFIRGGVEIFLDLAILILPLPVLAKLNMSKEKKLRIMSMFCVGFIITIASCLRLEAFVRFSTTQNPTYDNTSGLYWCATESNLFTIVACMPAVYGIMRRVLKRSSSTMGYGSKGHFGDGLVKGSYVRHDSEQHQKRPGSPPFGRISKATNVSIYHAERSESDVELVVRPPVA